MGFWDILLILLFLAVLGISAFSLYRIWKFRKMLSYTKEMLGKKITDLVNLPHLKGAQIPLNLPKKGDVVLYFYGPNCKLCPKQEEEIKKLPKNIRVFKFDIRTKRGKAVAALFRVLVLPSVVVLKNGVIKGYFTAFVPKDKLLKVLKEEG